MKRILIILYFLPSFFLFSCGKSGTDVINDLTNQNDLIYFDTFKDSTVSLGGPRTAYSERVCYDAGTEQIVWVKPNSKFSNLEFHIGGTGEGYSRNIIIGDNIYRIFTQSDDPISRPFSSTIPALLNGVYFQKIDKSTGNELIMKTIVSKPELNAGYAFGISRVETDGTHLYFCSANGNLYCFDLNGNLTWKKNCNRFTLMSNKYNYFYLDNGKIYITTFDPIQSDYKLNCIDGATGNVLWRPFHPGNPPVLADGAVTQESKVFPAMFFQSVYAVGFTSVSVGAISKSTGQLNPSDPGALYSGVPTTNLPGPQPYGLLADDIAFFKDHDGKLAFYKFGAPISYQSAITIDLTTKQYFYNGSKLILYGFSAANRRLKIIEPRYDGNSVLKFDRTYTFGAFPPSPPGTFGYYNYYDYPPVYKNNKLYVFANYYIDNNVCKINSPWVAGPNPPQNLALLIFDVNTGEIIKQIRNVSTDHIKPFKIFNVTAG